MIKIANFRLCALYHNLKTIKSKGASVNSNALDQWAPTFCSSFMLLLAMNVTGHSWSSHHTPLCRWAFAQTIPLIVNWVTEFKCHSSLNPSHLTYPSRMDRCWSGLVCTFLPLLAHVSPFVPGSVGVVTSPTRWKASSQRPYTVTCDIPVPVDAWQIIGAPQKVCLMEHFENVGHFSHLQDFCHIYLHFPLNQLTFKILFQEEK